jgi:Zn-finger nucleic acid-binding protein
MDCPRDNIEMTSLTDGEERVLYRCAECGGLWLDAADLNRILLHAGLPTLEAMGGRANPDEDAGDCPVDNVGLLAVESQHKRNPLVYETCESCGGIWLESDEFDLDDDETESPQAMTRGIVDFYREFSVNHSQPPKSSPPKAARK